MSYDLAVWDGHPPKSDSQAQTEFALRMKSREQLPPTPKIAALVSALTKRFPDIDTLSDDEIDAVDTPWATGPLLSEARGDLLYFPMTVSGAEAHLAEVVKIVLEHGLVCFDPQGGNVFNAPVAEKRAKRTRPGRPHGLRSPLVRAPVIFLCVVLLMLLLDKCAQ